MRPCYCLPFQRSKTDRQYGQKPYLTPFLPTC
nr:MAG TPA: hypothetical protein [Caudoviricetes sp.]